MPDVNCCKKLELNNRGERITDPMVIIIKRAIRKTDARSPSTGPLRLRTISGVSGTGITKFATATISRSRTVPIGSFLNLSLIHI